MMDEPLRATDRSQQLEPAAAEQFAQLEELALDLRWSRGDGADEIWNKIDPTFWTLTHNPWALLQTTSVERLHRQLADGNLCEKIGALIETKRRAAESPAWFQQNHASSPLKCVAYFSMEYMLSEALPIYSGGLGNVAGDQLKAASDLGVPVVGVGLLYQQGYFRQMIDKDGGQQALYPYNDPGQLPIAPLRDSSGEWLRLEIALPGYSVWLRAWQVQVGRLKLYLLDSNDAANFPAHRGITSELYGGGMELRLKQELLLGIGGWRLLAALGIRPDVCHLNEGHAAFAVLERAGSFMQETGQPFEVALAVTRAGNLFTTHTAVPAGFDRFTPALVEQYLGRYARDKLGISIEDLLALGRQDRDDSNEPFNMAYLAIRGSGAINGVSRLHGKVSRQLFEPLFPHWPEDDVPVQHVTNGVHVPTWNSLEAEALWRRTPVAERWSGDTPYREENIRSASDAELWKFRAASTRKLVEYARQRLSHMLAGAGAPSEDVEEAKHLLNADALILGFARRFATYKRPNLLLHDRERLTRLLTNRERPVQLILAGKAHPADQAGQAMIREWVQFIRQPAIRPYIIFLADYDMALTEHLVQGVDVWLNTPRRPWEASGTSGMKVLVNGGLNLSELDGWWVEAYTPEVGWAIGDGNEHGDDPAWDAAEAAALYDRLEHEVIPEFYHRGAEGIPRAWVARMRESMARLTPQFSAGRTVREYTEQHYLAAAEKYHRRSADGGEAGRKVVDRLRVVRQRWPALRFVDEHVETVAGQHRFEVQLAVGDVDPGMLRVELFANSPAVGGQPERHELARATSSPASNNTCVYRGAIPAVRPASEYTPRVVPNVDGVSVPLETSEILWQH